MTEASIAAQGVKDSVDRCGGSYDTSGVTEVGERKAMFGMSDGRAEFLVTVTELVHPAADLLTPEGLAKVRAAEDEADRQLFGLPAIVDDRAPRGQVIPVPKRDWRES